MAEETFRLPKSSYEELVRIIRAYGTAGNEASLTDVATTAAMNETIISRNNAFLMSVGIIEGGKAKSATEKGRVLAMALQHDIPDEISTQWRAIVSESDFLQKMVTAVSIRQGMEPSALQSHIAYSASEPKSPQVMAGAGAVVEILKISGFLKEADGKLVLEPSVNSDISSFRLHGNVQETRKQQPFLSDSGKRLPSPTPTGTNISIQIQVQCSASDIAELAPKLRALLRELSRPGGPDDTDQT